MNKELNRLLRLLDDEITKYRMEQTLPINPLLELLQIQLEIQKMLRDNF